MNGKTTMQKMTDEELIEEIRRRFEFNNRALNDLRVVTRKLEVMNEKLQDSESLKSQFLSNIRNEINNPLSAIMGLSGQFLDRHCDPDACRNAFNMIYAEAFNLDYQLQNVFMAAELEAGEAELAFAMVEVGNVLDNCLDKLSHRIVENNIEIVKNATTDLLFPTDAQKFSIILINLLGNAVEFSQPGGRVQISFEETAAGLTVAVEDNGPGIEVEDQGTIFDRFKQLEEGSTKGHRGHGLGLSICGSLAELLDGFLDLDSQPGRGSRFVLTLPRPEGAIVVHAKDGNLFLFSDADDEMESF